MIYFSLKLDIHVLPNPVLGEDGHYQPFEEVYGTILDETSPPLDKEHKNTCSYKKTLGFNASHNSMLRMLDYKFNAKSAKCGV